MAKIAEMTKTEQFTQPEELSTNDSYVMSSETSSLSEINKNISIAAYYKAEERGFDPGHEMEDWLEAEREMYM